MLKNCATRTIITNRIALSVLDSNRLKSHKYLQRIAKPVLSPDIITPKKTLSTSSSSENVVYSSQASAMVEFALVTAVGTVEQ